MSENAENTEPKYKLTDDWSSLSITEFEGAAFAAVQGTSRLVEDKLVAILGKERAFDIMARIWDAMNVCPMDLVKRCTPEAIAVALKTLKDCSVKEAAIVLRFIDNWKKDRVLELLSGESTWDWREVEKRMEKTLSEMNSAGEEEK